MWNYSHFSHVNKQNLQKIRSYSQIFVSLSQWLQGMEAECGQQGAAWAQIKEYSARPYCKLGQWVLERWFLRMSPLRDE